MKNRVPNPALPIDYTPKKRVVTENTIPPLPPCLNCNNNITDGFYARYSDGGVCSRTCMKEQDKKPKYPPPSKEFLQQLEQQDDLDFDQDISA